MEDNKGPSIIFIILALIIGSGLWREIDFENQTLRNPALAAVYFIAFVFAVIVIFRSFKQRPENK